jgi:hypothetical protein
MIILIINKLYTMTLKIKYWLQALYNLKLTTNRL